jgi:hypothetical protein
MGRRETSAKTRQIADPNNSGRQDRWTVREKVRGKNRGGNRATTNREPRAKGPAPETKEEVRDTGSTGLCSLHLPDGRHAREGGAQKTVGCSLQATLRKAEKHDIRDTHGRREVTRLVTSLANTDISQIRCRTTTVRWRRVNNTRGPGKPSPQVLGRGRRRRWRACW